ncbi:MAG: hypothetical protein U0324_07540 [Polyangiales bacterium]
MRRAAWRSARGGTASSPPARPTARHLRNLLTNARAAAVCATGRSADVHVSCVSGTTNCSGVCRDLTSDNANCGACARLPGGVLGGDVHGVVRVGHPTAPASAATC